MLVVVKAAPKRTLTTRHRPSAPTYAHLPPGWFRLCWVLILGLHGVAIAYAAFIAWFYLWLPGTYLDRGFQYVQLGLGTAHHPLVARIYVIAATPHVLSLVVMTAMSIHRRQLQWATEHHRHASVTSTITARILGSAELSSRMRSIWQHQLVLRGLRRGARWIYETLFSRRGIFGVDRWYYNELLLAREVLETGLQTYQGYQLSCFVSRPWLIRAFVGLLVLNCWINAAVHYVFRAREARRRLACLICDALLDLVSSIGVPCVVFFWYWSYYDPNVGGFPEALWYQDRFLVAIVTELQLFVVSSWLDLLSRTWLLFGLFSALSSIKSILRPRQRTRANAVAIASVKTNATTLATTNLVSGGPMGTPPRKTTKRYEPPLTSRALELIHRVGFGLWGLVILVLHLYAETQPMLPNCLLQAHAWGTSRPACSLLEIHCHDLGVEGTADEIADVLTAVDPAFVLRVVIRHCPTLVLPPELQHLRRLTGLKLYNSTIHAWDPTAAVTAPAHPELTFVHLVRVTLPEDGALPPGLMTRPFPPRLRDLELCLTNLAGLPADLDEIWHEASTIYLEFGHLTQYPEVLDRLRPRHLSLAGNPWLRGIPGSAFASPHLVYISIGATGLTALPADATIRSPVLQAIYASDLPELAFWYAWIDPALAQGTITLFAHNTRYCRELTALRREHAATDGFSITASPSTTTPLSAIAMNVSRLALLEAETPVEDARISCEPMVPWCYLWEEEDRRYGLSQPGLPPLVAELVAAGPGGP